MEKDWLPSQMERSHAPLMSWLTSWTSPGPEMVGSRMDGALMNLSSNHMLRSLQKTSGLFDKEFSGNFQKAALEVTTSHHTSTTDSCFDPVSSVSDSDLKELFGDNTDFLLSSLEKFPEEAGDGSDMFAALESQFDEHMEGGMDLEEFTDLSAAILGIDAEKMNAETHVPAIDAVEISSDPVIDAVEISSDLAIEVPSITPEPTATKKTSVRKTTKRRLKEKIPVEKKEVCMKVFQVVNHDHDDYTLKVKKPKLSTSSFDDYLSDTESVAESTTSSILDLPSTSSGRTPQEKYKVRRHKNNIASRRSRQTRKQKFVDMEEMTEQLETENKEMREKIVLMESLAKSLKQHLVTRMTVNQ